MTDHNEQFTPEQIDEQIDQFTQDKLHPMNNFMQDMHYSLQDHNEAFNRVWDNLHDYIQHTPKSTPMVQNKIYERIHVMSQIPNLDHPKQRSRLIMTLSLVASIFLAVLLTGSAFAFFQVAHLQQTHTTNNKNTTVASHNNKQATATPTPTPSGPALPSEFCSPSIYPPDSWADICASHQYTMINQTKTMNNEAVTIYAGYADSNNIILAYTYSGPGQPNFSLSAQKGVTITGHGNGSGEGTKSAMYTVQYYSVSSVLQGTNALDIIANQGLFHFVLPFHQGRTTYLNQTQTVDGQAVTLESVSVSPTMTRIFLRAPNFNSGSVAPTNTTPFIQLTVGNWNFADHGRGFDSVTSYDSNNLQQPGGLELNFSSSLVNQKGEWTLTLNGIVSGTTGNVTFHFTA
jgi:hypothetical protein